MKITVQKEIQIEEQKQYKPKERSTLQKDT